LISFDDGPNPYTTEIILNELEKYSIKSIFFCVGENMERYPTIAKEILTQGHEIGNHTYRHKMITKLTQTEIISTIEKVQQISLHNFDYNINYFRAPYGKIKLNLSKTLSSFKLKNVMWSLLTYDYKNDLNIVKFVLDKYLNANSIIVLHDSNKSKDVIVDSIKAIVEIAEVKKYQIGNPSECLK
jgi:peptidoglycan/xylan/chitin deacetylase (PgdA/CDA1 family)